MTEKRDTKMLPEKIFALLEGRSAMLVLALFICRPIATAIPFCTHQFSLDAQPKLLYCPACITNEEQPAARKWFRFYWRKQKEKSSRPWKISSNVFPNTFTNVVAHSRWKRSPDIHFRRGGDLAQVNSLMNVLAGLKLGMNSSNSIRRSIPLNKAQIAVRQPILTRSFVGCLHMIDG